MKEEMEWHKKAKALSERNSVQMKSGAPPTLRLTVELVPKPLWGRSLAKLAPRSEWGALRQQVFGKFGAEGTDGTTLREIVHLSIGGPAVRVIFTNEFGEDPLTIGAAEVAVRSTGNEVVAGSSTPLTFSAFEISSPFVMCATW